MSNFREVIILVGNVSAVMTMQVRSSQSTDGKVISRTLSESVLNQIALRDTANNYSESAGAVINDSLLKVYALSTNTVTSYYVTGKVNSADLIG